MIWRWLISSSVLMTAGVLGAATLSGRVTLKDSRDPAVAKGRDYSGVVVSLRPTGASNVARRPPRRARMVQKDKTFIPHVLAVQVGAAVEFPNYDPIFHNAFSNYNGQVFDVGLYPPGESRTVILSREGVVRVFCNIHSSMSAVIVVLNSPWFGTTRRDGTFEIADVPPGEYVLSVFHERATPQEMKQLERTIQVSGENVSLGTVTMSESGYLPTPHKNKYGREYPAADDNSLYPATRK